MIWTSDKIEHYKFCYNLTAKFPPYIRIVTFILALAIGAAKELVYDLMLGKGHPEWADFKADYYGAMDALMNKKSRF